VLTVFTLSEAIEKIEQDRYLDNDCLTKFLEEKLSKIPGMVIEYYPNNQRTYTLFGNYK